MDRELDVPTTHAGLDTARELIAGGQFHLVVLDEIHVVASYDYLPAADIVACLEARADRTTPPPRRYTGHRS